jgi:DNA-binding XRE family transcriptional regulator
VSPLPAQGWSDWCKQCPERPGLPREILDEVAALEAAMSVGARIKRRRENRMLTQAELAAACGVAPGQVSRWERDKDEPSLASLRALARVLQTTTDKIVG